MARPRKHKRICRMPHMTRFYAEEKSGNAIALTLEEYETIRLIDGENLTQEECALQMEVSRPTVQILYARARRKIAQFLSGGGMLQIEGGDYRVCDKCSKCRRKCGCGKKED